MNLKEKIQKLKKEKNAVILCHYYQRPEIQEVADYIGDSYYLSKIGKESMENTIVFCGVKFMAESAKILSPQKSILFPNINAGCPMADMATLKQVKEFKKENPNVKIVCYVNSSSEVKALSDVCCTSSNAIKIINKLDCNRILFLPDKNLGSYIQEKVKDKEIILWKGFCVSHSRIDKKQVLKVKNSVENLITLAHPECEKEIREEADFIGSTGQMIDYISKSLNKDFLVLTEEGILHTLNKNNPDKNFYTLDSNITCSNMKKVTLNDVYESLLYGKHDVKLEEDIMNKAYKSLNNMHTLSK